MDKKIIGMTCAGGTGVTAIAGGSYLASSASASKSNHYENLSDIKLDHKETNKHKKGCLPELFPDLKNLNNSNNNNHLTTITNNSESSSNTKGCLIIKGKAMEIINSANDDDEVEKRGGEFQFLWAIKSNEKGLIVLAHAYTDKSSDKKFIGTGNAYSLKKDNTAGTVEASQSISESSKSYKELNKDKFPKLSIQPSESQNQGFLDILANDTNDKPGCEAITGDSLTGNDNDYSNRCTGSMKFSSFTGYGDWQGNSTDSDVGGGMTNLEEWGKEVFTEDNGKIKDIVKDIKGKGILKYSTI